MALIKDIKEVRRARIKEYTVQKPNAVYTEGCKGIWNTKCDIALPCATQNELDEATAQTLVPEITTVFPWKELPLS